MPAMGKLRHEDDWDSSIASPRPYLPQTVVMVGLMGAGKSAIGMRLAVRLQVPFIDVDTEIESDNSCKIATFFSHYGEAAFRDSERRVIARLLTEPVRVLATGGGAFMDLETRAAIKAQAVSVWLKAELDVLIKRTTGRTHRPLLQDKDPRAVLAKLIAERYPVYATADITVESTDGPHEIMLERVVMALAQYLDSVLLD